MENRSPSILSRLFSLRHYYGDTVRQLFLVAAIAIFIMTPFLAGLSFAFAAGMALAALLLVLFAGLTNPRLPGIALVDAVIAGFGCFFFELLAMQIYAATADPLNLYFAAFQLLALDFLLAFYFSIKTTRAMRIAQKDAEDVQ